MSTRNADAIVCRPFDRLEWKLFRSIREEALRTNPEVFAGKWEEEARQPAQYWQDWIESPRTRCFGLFAGREVIGCTGIVTMREDPSGETALLVASFIRPEYRGRNLSDKLYRARIDFALDHPQWEKIVVSHREGNESSRRANQRHGFILTHAVMEKWPDGKTANNVYYALDLAPLRQARNEISHAPRMPKP